MAELFISRRTEEELRQIWCYIAAENPTAADRLLLRIDDKLQILRDFPGAGTSRDDIRPGSRMLVEGNYLLLYEHDTANDAVEVVAVVDGRRNVSELSEPSELRMHAGARTESRCEAERGNCAKIAAWTWPLNPILVLLAGPPSRLTWVA